MARIPEAVALLLTIAIAPGAFWLWYFLQRDRLRPEPRFLIQRVFLLGMVAAFVAGILEFAYFRSVGPGNQGLVLRGVVLAAAVIGIIEEGVKFLAVYLRVYRRAEFNEVLDGIIYMVAASLGFATIENVFYVYGGGVSVGVARALLSVPGHAFFGALSGFYMGVAKFAGAAEGAWLLRGVALAAVAHAAYDAVVLSGTVWALAAIPIVIILWRRAVVHVREAQALDDRRFGGTSAGGTTT